MRRPKINGFVDRKLKNWVVKGIESPLFSVRDLLFILLLVGYACTSMLPSMIAIAVHISLMLFCICMEIKYFVIFCIGIMQKNTEL